MARLKEMTFEQRQRTQIVDGPSKFDFMVSVFDSKVVQFSLKNFTQKEDFGFKYNFKITGVISKGNNNWLFYGFYSMSISPQDKTKQKWYSIQGRYNMTTRKGHIEI